jgi:calcium/calmodulin-dependent protein kinase I
MQAILIADFSFTPLEYWRGVSLSAREFIKKCLTIDPTKRLTSHEALQHPFVAERREDEGGEGGGDGEDLLPVIKKNFNARRTLHAAIDTIRAINKLREGGAAAMMEGAMSREPPRGAKGRVGGDGDGNDSGYGGSADGGADGGVQKMDIDSRGNARGQTEKQIREQERKVHETSRGLWAGR